MAFNCCGCDRTKSDQFAYCASCDEDTDGYIFDGSYSDKDRDIDNYAKRFRELSVVEKINKAERIGERAVAKANMWHERQSNDWWNCIIRECCSQGGL